MTNPDSAPQVAPVLSTPDTHILEDTGPTVDTTALPRLSDDQLAITYEIERTIREIRASKWRRIALQFPDAMLIDAPRVYQSLQRGLRCTTTTISGGIPANELNTSASVEVEEVTKKLESSTFQEPREEAEIFILADTSYGACCVDEIAAEHVEADVVVHYGRSCLSPTARLPVIYVFTTRPLDLDVAAKAFEDTYPSHDQKVILMADVSFQSHLVPLAGELTKAGYTSVFPTDIINSPSSPLPNRSLPNGVAEKPELLLDYELFHISEPPTALLLTLSSRVGTIHIYPTDHVQGIAPTALKTSSAMALRRRYALLTRLSTVPVFGILVNTLSVKNYMHVVQHVKRRIAAAGKKSYTFVVGKVNAAKVANFSEVGGWVVVGCWESSLIESKDFWKPLITPFELDLALKGDAERIWTGEWSSDFQAVLDQQDTAPIPTATPGVNGANINGADDTSRQGLGDIDSEEESEPPEFDLRTGRYISHSRPMREIAVQQGAEQPEGSASAATSSSTALAKRADDDIAQIGGVVSPGAEFLRSKRTWQGLGSDFEVSFDRQHSAQVEQGRSGLARGYVVGDDTITR